MNILDLSAEDILGRIDVRLDEYKAAAEEAARLESAFKAWEASRRVAIIDAGKTATYATDAVRADDEWTDRYMEMERAKIEAEHVKAKVGQGIRYLEIWRSKYASERRATQ